MWNSANISAPPINTFQAKAPNIDLNAIISIIENGLNHLQSLDILKTEVALLCKTIYFMKLRFRCDKGFKFLEKTTKLVRKALSFNMQYDLMNFLELVPRKYEKIMYLPTKQMLQYILIRMQGFSKFLCRIIASARITGHYMNCRLNLGHFWAMASLWLASMGRIWQISKYLVQKCCNWYNDLIPLLNVLKVSGVEWLINDYEFPENLAEWLNEDWMKETSNEEWNKFQVELPIFSLLNESDDEDDVQFCFQYKLNDYYVIDDSINETDLITVDDDDDVQIVAGNDTLNEIKNISEVKNKPPCNIVNLVDDDIGTFIPRTNKIKKKGMKPEKKSKLKKSLKKRLETLLTTGSDNLDEITSVLNISGKKNKGIKQRKSLSTKRNVIEEADSTKIKRVSGKVIKLLDTEKKEISTVKTVNKKEKKIKQIKSQLSNVKPKPLQELGSAKIEGLFEGIIDAMEMDCSSLVKDISIINLSDKKKKKRKKKSKSLSENLVKMQEPCSKTLRVSANVNSLNSLKDVDQNKNKSRNQKVNSIPKDTNGTPKINNKVKKNGLKPKNKSKVKNTLKKTLATFPITECNLVAKKNKIIPKKIQRLNATVMQQAKTIKLQEKSEGTPIVNRTTKNNSKVKVKSEMVSIHKLPSKKEVKTTTKKKKTK